MKKILLVLMTILLLTGCKMNMSSPTAKVEETLNNYQKLDNSIDNDLNKMIEKENNYSEEDKKNYRTALERQFQNLSYKIKNEEIDGEKAKVEVEIEVLDYKSSYDKSKKYFLENKDEFIKDDIDEGKVEELSEFITYKIKELSKMEDKVKHNITFDLRKEDKDWVIEDISDENLEKLLGLY